MDYCLNQNGLLSFLSNGSRKTEIPDDIIIRTDSKEYNLSKAKISEISDTSFEYSFPDAKFWLRYYSVDNSSFINRKLTAKFKDDTKLLEIKSPLPKAEETILYNTFFNASAAVFIRNGDEGICVGFENPYVEVKDDFFGFCPSLILKGGEEFECDLCFYGIYKIFGEKVSPKLLASEIERNGRFHPRYRNPSEGTPLYFSEIMEFCRYTDNYFGIRNKKFRFTSYNFFGNLPQRPSTDDEIKAYKEHIDAFVNLGGDTIILNPLYPNEIPNESENSAWELFPENTSAYEIYSYAKEKGLNVGIYMGTAGNGLYGNSSLIPYSDNKSFKKQNFDGTYGYENCIADDGFCDWFIKVQANTIKKYGLSVWNWDPGPGNAFFCHSENHGHLPGKGDYKGFRNSLRVMKSLKEQFPDLYFEGFHGNKEYGLWGFKYIDQHEAFWENEIYIMTPVFPDLSPDRVTADGIRLQSTWNYYFRFMSAALNHGISHRMLQSCWMNMTDLDSLFDYTGWKFALLSAIASGGSVTPTIIPRNPEKIDGYIEFYKKWISFARDNFEYSKNTVPFGSQVCAEGVDGFAKIIDNKGYMFLCNPYPHPVETEIVFNERIGFGKTEGIKTVTELYPDCRKTGEISYGDTLKIIVPAYEVLVLSVGFNETATESPKTEKPLARTLETAVNGNKTVATFFADEKIKEILEYSKKYVSNLTISTEEKYCAEFKKVNIGWTRPDRLWLWVIPEKLTESENFSLTVNSQKCEVTREYYNHHKFSLPAVFFADITDKVAFGKENSIEVTCPDTAVHLYLSYPKSENECEYSVPKRITVTSKNAPIIDESVVITEAYVNDNNRIIQDCPNTLYAKVNLPYEELEGVYASVPISIGDTGMECKCDMELTYQDGIWKKVFKSGSRMHLIIDDEKIVVWAVTKKNTESKGFNIPIDWYLYS